MSTLSLGHMVRLLHDYYGASEPPPVTDPQEDEKTVGSASCKRLLVNLDFLQEYSELTLCVMVKWPIFA